MSLEDKIARAKDLLGVAIAEHRPVHIVALFSGGHDSLVALDIARKACALSFACHIDTGIGVPATRDFVGMVATSLAVPLKVYSAQGYTRPDGTPAPQSYRDLVLERGFPGPAMHTKMFNRLKERPLRHMLRDLKARRGERVLLVSGLRSSESARRSRYRAAVQVWEGTKMWVAPLWEFDKLDVGAYMAENGLPRNPVVSLLHKSGECLCGAFARPGEKEELRLWYPAVAAHIDELEREVRERGFLWGWGSKPVRPLQSSGRYSATVLCSSCTRGDGPTEDDTT